MKASPSTPRTQTQLSILRSARAEIERNGILGLRVADVAEGANCSITQIYRYFGDRDGLLAAALGDIYDESVTGAFDGYMARMKKLKVITVDDLVDNLPTPSDSGVMASQEARIQILATSVKNTALRERIENISVHMHGKWEEGLDYVESKLPPGVRIDRRVFMIMLSVQMMYYRTLHGDVGFTDDEYRRFLRDKLTS